MSKSLCVTVVGIVLAALPGSAAADPGATRTVPTVSPATIEPITFTLRDGSTIAAERGSFAAPEQRGSGTSRSIKIGFIRFKSTSAHPGPPIVYLAGGPGASGVDAAHGPRQPIFMALRALGDVIALDQRGTGLSNAIPPCTADTTLDPSNGISEAILTDYYRRTLRSCLETWRTAGVSVGGYNTRENADDLNDLRQALGADKLRLWGISYGTHLALETMRRHPAAIDRVVLASAEGMDQTVKLPNAVDAALGRIAAVTEGAAPGDLIAKMRRVHARLDAAPASLSVEGPAGPVRFTMDSFALRMLVGAIVKNPDGIGKLAALYATFDAGQEQALAPVLYGIYFKAPLVMTGMPELMDLASGVSRSRLRTVQSQARTAIVGDAINFPMPQIANAAPDLVLDDGFRHEVRSPIPTLLFSGDLDVRTPLEEQAIATDGLTHLTRVVVHNGGHDLFEADPRIAAMIETFMAGGTIHQTSLTVHMPTPGQSR